jgi:hypothetical protein
MMGRVKMINFNFSMRNSFTIFLLCMYSISQSSASICIEGYVMDTYCIEDGVLLDNPSVVTLLNPEKHSAHCLLDVPVCLESYEILVPPSTDGGEYTRGYKLDAAGLQLAIDYGRRVGKGCSVSLVASLLFFVP